MFKSAAVLLGLVLLPWSLSLAAASPDHPDLHESFESGEGAPLGWSPMAGAVDGLTCTWLVEDGRRGGRAVQATSTKARAAWVSENVSVHPEEKYILDGWIRARDGAGWLEISFVDANGKVLARHKSPQVENCPEWRYVAAEASAPPGEAVHARADYWVRGGSAALDDVSLHRAPVQTLINGDFEMPLDRKKRFPYWNEEQDKSLLSGGRGGKFALDGDDPAQGVGCLALTAARDWFAFTSIHYPVSDWTKEVSLSAMVSQDTDAEARLAIVWTDAAQKPITVQLGKAAKTTGWQEMVAGPFNRPAGAYGVRPVLAVRKRSAGSQAETTARFDNVTLHFEDKPFLRVAVNQVGYEADGPKGAVVLSNFFPAKATSAYVEILDENGRLVREQEVACAGRMYGEKQADWGWYFWPVDFSPLRTAGEFKVKARVGRLDATSYPFSIERDLLFSETAQSNVDFFFVQRCGFEVPGWHAACHLDDAKLPDGTHRDLTGGWHSAGDYNKLNWEYGDGGVMYALINAYESAPDFFEQFDRDGAAPCDIVDEAWWGAKFLAKVQVPETGGILNHIEQGPDRRTWMNWCPPEKTTDNTVGTADDPVVTEGEGQSPLAIGGWARLAALLDARGVETDYLARAVRLWEHATKGGSSFGQPLALIGTVDLYAVTGEQRYLDFCRQSAQALLDSGDPEGQLPGGYADSGDIPAAALAYFAIKLSEEALVKPIRDRLEKHLPFFLAEAANPAGLMMQKLGADGYFFDPSSALGCNYQLCSRAWSALMVYRITRDRRAWEYAANQLDFVLGKNPYGVCMMEGEGSYNLPRYHHRYITIPGHERGAVPGAIPNGFVRDMAGNDRPGIDLSTGGRAYPSYRTNEPWLVHNVLYTLAITALHDVQRLSSERK